MAAPAYTEVAPSPAPDWYTDSKGRIQFRARRWLKCAWTDLSAMIVWLYSEAGAAYPHPDGTPYALVRSVKPVARGRTGLTNGLISHSEAVVEVLYDTAGPMWVNGVYVEEMIVPQRFPIRPVGYGLKWSDGTKLSPEDYLPLAILGATHIYHIGRSSTYPTNAFSFVGMCNSGTKSCLILTSYTFSTQTVLYQPPRVSAQSDYSVGTKYDITYHHDINPNGWNKFWHAANNAWEFLKTPSDDTYIQYPVGW
jgi:hypothetical protein